MKELLGILILVGFLTYSSAEAIDCGPAKVTAIQPDASKVMVRIERDSMWVAWKKLGEQGLDVTKSFQSVAQQAFAANEWVYLRYADGYDCSVTDYTTQPQMIRIFR